MPAIGLAIFTIGVAIFSAFHSAPIPFIRNQVDYPVRLLGSVGFGVAFSSLERIAGNAFKKDGDAYPQQIGPPESSTPHLDALTTALSELQHSTTGFEEEDFDEEDFDETPVIGSLSMPDPTIFIVEESPVTELVYAPPVCSDPAVWMDFTQPRKTAPKAERFGKLNQNVNYIVLATYVSIFLVFIAYLFFLKSVAQTTYRHAGAEAAEAAETAKGEIERLVLEIQSHQARVMRTLGQADEDVEKTISELPSRKSRLLATVDEAQEQIDKAIGKDSALWDRMLLSKRRIENTCEKANHEADQLQQLTAEIAGQYLQMSKLERLLEEEVAPVREMADEAKSGVERLVDAATKEVKGLVTEATSEVNGLVTEATHHAERKMNEALESGLGGIPERFAKEKARMADTLRQLEEMKASCPEIPILRARVVLLEQDMKSCESEVEKLEHRAKAAISGLPGLMRRSDEIKVG